MATAEAYLHAKFHLGPSNRFSTIHQRYRQTDNGRPKNCPTEQNSMKKKYVNDVDSCNVIHARLEAVGIYDRRYEYTRRITVRTIIVPEISNEY